MSVAQAGWYDEAVQTDPREVNRVATRLILAGVPDRRLSANNRRRMHHMAEADITAKVKTDFGWLLKSQYQGDVTASPVRVWIRVIWPKGTRLGDLDSVIAMCKPVLDAMQGIVFVNDKQIVRLTHEQARDDTGTWPDGCTVIDVEAA